MIHMKYQACSGFLKKQQSLKLSATNFRWCFNHYGKYSKISDMFLFLFSNKMLVIRVGIHKMLVRIANREDPGQTTSTEAV